jgi:hypothetical protein
LKSKLPVKSLLLAEWCFCHGNHGCNATCTSCTICYRAAPLFEIFRILRLFLICLHLVALRLPLP